MAASLWGSSVKVSSWRLFARWLPFGSSSVAAPRPWQPPFGVSSAKVSSWRLFARRSSLGALRPLRLPFGSPCSLVVSVSRRWVGLLGFFQVSPHGVGVSSSGVLVMPWVFLASASVLSSAFHLPGSFSMVSPPPWWFPSCGSSTLLASSRLFPGSSGSTVVDLPLVVSAAWVVSSRRGVVLLAGESTSLAARWAPWRRVGLLGILLVIHCEIWPC